MDWLALSDAEWTAIHLSLRISVVAMLASLPFGILVAMALARGRFWGKSLLNGLVHLPLILPPVVTGFLLLILFGRRGPIGALLDEWFGIVLSFRWTGAALACGVMGFPLMVRSIRLSIEAVDRKLEEAAGTLGASPAFVFATITLPLILPGILSGALFAFITSFDEIIVALFITSPYLKTLPVQIYTSITRDADPTVAAVGTLLFFATSLIIIAGLLFGMRRGRT